MSFEIGDRVYLIPNAGVHWAEDDFELGDVEGEVIHIFASGKVELWVPDWDMKQYTCGTPPERVLQHIRKSSVPKGCITPPRKRRKYVSS